MEATFRPQPCTSQKVVFQCLRFERRTHALRPTQRAHLSHLLRMGRAEARTRAMPAAAVASQRAEGPRQTKIQRSAH
jgi:hypothetical protein